MIVSGVWGGGERGPAGLRTRRGALILQQFGKIVRHTLKEYWTTVDESVAKVTASLRPEKQQEVLDFVRLHKERKGVRAIAGIWKDRTDLPKDGVQAVKVLRSRMKSKGRHD